MSRALNLVIKSVDLSAKVLCGNVTLHLLRRSEKVLGEGLNSGEDALDELEAVQFVLLGYAGKALDKLSTDLLVLNGTVQSIDVGRVNLLAKDVRDQLGSKSRFKNGNSNKGGAERVTVNDKGSVDGVEGVNTLNLLQRNVLALAELDDVLHAVNDLQTASGVDLSDVAGVHPSIRVDGLGGILGVVEVALEDVGAADADLTARVGRVLVGVAHLSNVDELDLIAGLDLPGGADCIGVLRDTLGGRTDSLSQAVALDNVTAEANLEHLVHGSGQRSGTRRHVNNLATSESAQLAEDESVVQAVSDRSRGAEVGELGLDSLTQESSLETRLLHLDHDCSVDAVPNARNAGEEVGLEDLGVLEKLQSVASGETNDAVAVDDENLQETLIDVAKGKVGEELPALLLEEGRDTERVGNGGRGHVPVGKDHALGVASGSAGVANRDNTVNIKLLLTLGRTRSDEVPGLHTPLLHLDLVEKEDAKRTSPLRENIALSRRQSVHGDDDTERGAPRSDAEKVRQVVGRGENERKGAVVGAARLTQKAGKHKIQVTHMYSAVSGPRVSYKLTLTRP